MTKTKLNLSGRNVKSHGVYSAENVFNWDSNKRGFEFMMSDGNISLEIGFSELRENSIYITRLNLKSNITGKVLIQLSCKKIGDEYVYSLRCVESLASLDIPAGLALEVLINGHDSFKGKSEKARQNVREFGIEVHDSKIRNNVWSGEQKEPISRLSELERILFGSWMTKNMEVSKQGKEAGVGAESKMELFKLFRPIKMLGEIFDRYSNVKHLSSKRAVAPRLVMRTDESFDMYKEWSSKDLSTDAKRFVLKWIKKFSIGDDFKIEFVEGVAIKVKIMNRGKEINLADKGMGEAQLWRIIFTLGSAIDESRLSPVHLLIEEPDSNLHPAYQSKLVEPILDSLTKS